MQRMDAAGPEWPEKEEDGEVDGVCWSRTNAAAAAAADDDDDEMGLSSFKSMLEVDDDWYTGCNVFPPDPTLSEPTMALQLHHNQQGLDSSSSCSPSPVFTLDPSGHFFPQKSALSSLLGFDSAGFGLGGYDHPDPFLTPAQMPNGGVLGFSGGGSELMEYNNDGDAAAGGFEQPEIFGGFENSLFLNRPKTLQPLDVFPPAGGAPPTLFQKRAAAALRHNKGFGDQWGGGRRNGDDDFDDVSVDGSGLNYDSDEVMAAENVKSEKNESNGNSTVTTGDGEKKGKKKGLPAKNLMAERRRRKKLNDRLYMLRSVVPKISKMDRASILGDAIEYLKELLQRINDLHNELESSPSSSALPTPTSSSIHPLTPTPLTLPCRVKEELCQSSLPSPNGQPATVEVRVRDGGAVNIHMFCVRRPGLLLSTMRALDGLGLDIQQAVISCFNGFALDVFRAEQCKDGPGVLPDDVKAILLHSVGLQGST